MCLAGVFPVDSGLIDVDFVRGGEGEGDRGLAEGFDGDGLGFGGDLGDGDAGAGAEAFAGRELEEGGVLVADAGDGAAVAFGEVGEGR